MEPEKFINTGASNILNDEESCSELKCQGLMMTSIGDM